MSEEILEALLNRADALARESNWQGAYECLLTVTEINPQHVGALTGVGTCLLQMGQVDQSLPYFRKVVDLAPDTPDAYNNLGVALTLTQQYKAAEGAYQKAIQLNPEHLPAWKNLAQIYLQQEEREVEGAQILAALVQVNPQDVEVLMMLAGCYEKVGDTDSAKTLWQEVLKLQPDCREALIALKRFEGHSNGFVRLARPEHAKKLAALKQRLKAPSAIQAKAMEHPSGVESKEKVRSVAFFAPPNLSSSHQMEMLLRPFSEHGWTTKFAHEVDKEDFETYDLFVFCQPNLSANLIEGINQCLRLNKTYYVYLNDDFHHLPQSHPAYHHFGPGNPKALEVLEIILENSQGLVVPSRVLGERYQNIVKKVEFIPPGWSTSNPLWSKKSPSRSTFNIGWLGSGGDRADLQSIKKEILKLMKATPRTFLVIIGDPMGYELFSEIAEQRRIFLPLSNYEDTPYVLSQVDLLLVPLRQNEYNQARSDLPLLEAGVRGIPWLASPIPAFEEWGVGGQLVEHAGEWVTAMQSMLNDVNWREGCGQAGMVKASSREIEKVFEIWQSALT